MCQVSFVLPTFQVSFTHVSDYFYPRVKWVLRMDQNSFTPVSGEFYPWIRLVLPTCQVSFTRVSGEFYPRVRWVLPISQVSFYPRVRWVLRFYPRVRWVLNSLQLYTVRVCILFCILSTFVQLTHYFTSVKLWWSKAIISQTIMQCNMKWK